MTSRCDEILIIRPATETGFVIEANGEMVAAMATPSEVALWVQQRLEQLPGEAERRQQDQMDAEEAMPSVIRADRKWFGGRA